jgi:chemotaxis response regulator CheB
MRLGVSASGFQLSPLPPSASSWLASADHLVNTMVACTIDVVLSGMVAAGVNGMRAMKAAGGFTLAQDRTSSRSFEMPAAAKGRDRYAA